MYFQWLVFYLVQSIKFLSSLLFLSEKPAQYLAMFIVVMKGNILVIRA